MDKKYSQKGSVLFFTLLFITFNESLNLLLDSWGLYKIALNLPVWSKGKRIKNLYCEILLGGKMGLKTIKPAYRHQK